ncbi:hypothetical protein [Alkalibacterium sp. 20]|nr:hypothetical protein [Alkalibacterium sp. 20]
MSHKTKGTAEEEILLIQRYLTGEISASVASKMAGVDYTSFKSWVHL